MKIALDRISFLDELLFVNDLVVKNTANENYRFVHVFNENKKMRILSGNNGLAFAQSVMETDVHESFAFSVIPDKLITILKTFSSTTVNLSIADNKLIVSSGKSKYTFKTQDAINIYMESLSPENSTDCNYILFKKATDTALDFTKTSNTSAYTLAMFEMILSPTHISTRATDGNKMVHSSFEDVKDERDMSINIDRDYVYVLDKLNNSERLSIEQYQNNTVFISGNRKVKIMSKLGILPDTYSVVEKVKKANTLLHVINKSDIIEPLKRINSISEEKVKKITIHFGKNHAKLVNQENEEEFISQGEDHGKFALNGQNLADILKNSSDILSFYFDKDGDFALYINDANSEFIIGKAV